MMLDIRIQDPTEGIISAPQTHVHQTTLKQSCDQLQLDPQISLGQEDQILDPQPCDF